MHVALEKTSDSVLDLKAQWNDKNREIAVAAFRL